MNVIKRTLQNQLTGLLGKGKVILIIGARQVGKTTLLRQISQSLLKEPLWLNCDQAEVSALLSTTNLSDLKLLFQQHKVVVIDEAQRVKNIGLVLKLVVDNFPDVQLLVTGSSSLDLQNKLNEPLTGRKIEYHLFPLSTTEIYEAEGLISVREKLEQRLIFGSYPDVLYGQISCQKTLQELSNSYLFKDILVMDDIRKSDVLRKLLVALALQIGSEVSYNELSKTVGVDSKTVEKYINLLEKCFVVFRLGSFSRNIRSELTKSKKIYFYDLGIRNAIINQFPPLSSRQDVGALWENFFIVERLKRNHYQDRIVNTYFWRTKDKQEIDYIEEENGQLSLFEMKWNPQKGTSRLSNLFMNTYNPTQANVITPENYLNFLL